VSVACWLAGWLPVKYCSQAASSSLKPVAVLLYCCFSINYSREPTSKMTGSSPTQDAASTAATIERSYIEHEPKWQRFQATTTTTASGAAACGGGGKAASAGPSPHPYQRQYSHVYHQRLAMLGPRCWEQVELQESNATESEQAEHVKRILDLKEGQPSVAVGTLVREPSDDRNKDFEYYLEDESGRVALEFADKQAYPMGVVMAVFGTVRTTGGGIMDVRTVYPPIPKLVLQEKAAAAAGGGDGSMEDGDSPPCLLLVSGLRCGDPTAPTLPREMLLSYLEGRFPGRARQSASKIGQIVIAGGLVAPPPKELQEQQSSSSSWSSTQKDLAKEQAAKANRLAALRDLDAWILRVAAAGIPVDIIPGKDDPTTANWPQRPLHRSLLPQSNRYFSSGTDAGRQKIIHRTPNPYAAKLAQKNVVGTDGTNIADLTQQCNLGNENNIDADAGAEEKMQEDDAADGGMSELDALRLSLQWSHICPTGPSSVPTAPHAETDPMVMPPSSSDGNDDDDDAEVNNNPLPDLYFCGNASKFDTAIVAASSSSSSSHPSSCRLVCVPEFSKTGQAVLVHMDGSMKVELLRFLQE